MVVDPKSSRLQLLAPFNKWDGKDFVELPILIKASLWKTFYFTDRIRSTEH